MEGETNKKVCPKCEKIFSELEFSYGVQLPFETRIETRRGKSKWCDLCVSNHLSSYYMKEKRK